jgi:hypothetical protein
MSSSALAQTAVATTVPAKRPGRPRAFVDLARVHELAGQGLSMNEISRAMGVSERLMWSRLENDPDVKAAYNAGISEVLDLTTKTLLDLVKERNLGACIFMLRNRFKWTAGAQLDVTVRREPAPAPTIDGHVLDLARAHTALLDGPDPDSMTDAEFTEVFSLTEAMK